MRHEAARQAEAARTEAEAASSAKDVFLATLSHELRQPLGSILGWVRLLQRPDVDADRRTQLVERLERSVHTLTRLIDDLLDVSSIVTGKMRLNLQPMDLREPIDGALDIVRPAATAKGVQLHTTLDPRTPPIIGDADRLQQVIWNLLSNAVKFTPAGGRVTVALRQEHARVLIEVCDSGRGISPELMPRLFERFTQAAQDLRRPVPGLGLGLAIARHLVELHGGTITADGQGKAMGRRSPSSCHRPPAWRTRGGVDVAGERAGVSRVRRSSGGHLFRLQQVLPALAAAGRSGHGPVTRVSGVSS